MGFKSDIEIAQECEMKPITEIAAKAGIDDKYLEQYGKYKAKIDYNLLKETDKQDGKLILVTAINPTPAGEGKTTTTVGLADGMQKLGKNVMVALREPSLGPVFGVKGGAAGGGYAQVVPNCLDQICIGNSVYIIGSDILGITEYRNSGSQTVHILKTMRNKNNGNSL